MKRKRILNALLGVLVSVSIIACSAGSNVETQTSENDGLKIGFISTTSGPQSIIGQHMIDGFNLGIKHAGGSLGGLETEVIVGDDQVKPDIGLQVADKLLKSDRVDMVAGVIWSNVMMAIHQPITDSETILIGTNAGPSPIAGAQCSPYFFSTSYQNDQVHAAMGQYAQDQGVQEMVLIAPNYQAGKDGLAGFKEYYQGNVADEIYTELGQVDFSAVMSRVSSLSPEAVYVFMPGSDGINFIKQWEQAGLSDQIPLYSGFTINAVTLPAIGDAAEGLMGGMFWVPDMDNPVNQKFVEDFQATYGYAPSEFAASSYDAALLIDSALKQVNGDLSDKEALREALKQANFESVRGSFKFNTNQFPIQNFYVQEVVRGEDGALTLQTKDQIFTDFGDKFASQCSM
ncbi:ABC transporter substrate-binding protein [Oscillatoria sp. FACHB-1407]|uniref:ABC transporter substrate-binding protein n=1 Tax=Oscillatoria sp. FACHB-1407 TaxID=2692847 RepID=UPI001687116D|nr:ABC transporter substrate-binding protein [Oscillatoria sp. FACHB-1407]MBD2465754.1 ABC transporter substrate-binding protein [Oscillatoria sp. FACHB-1407]